MFYNPEFIIMKNNIISKKGNLSFEIPYQIYDLIKNNELSNIENLYTEIFNYLEKNNIIIKGDGNYNPFIINNDQHNNLRLFIQLTKNCNLSCLHCFQGSEKLSNPIIKFNDLKDIINEAIEKGIYKIDFTGGEISTLNYIEELFEFLNNKPICSNIFTNLAFNNKKIINSIINCKSISTVITSVDYFRKSKHDYFRGAKGAYERTINNIKILRDNNIDVIVNTMILKDNRNEILDIIRYFNNMGVNVQLDTLVLRGNAIKNEKQISSDNNEEKFIYEILKQENLINEKFKYSMTKVGCGIGKNLIFLDNNLKYQLCPGLTDDLDSFFFMGKTLTSAINKLKNVNIQCKVKNCEYINDCSYGCREKSLFENGNIYSRDNTFCSLREKIGDLYEKENRISDTKTN
ncbi:MAG: radical SAM protein [Tissierellia bacterium]|nr:radical SAM protein [Tissierellia bacterium]